ncbi:hypothetical protein B0H11DRAFT_1924738 [Mycena galericulata]|nr:hypothetical protein B0H11DRAFT_1924738 [Mycena galericulata]
MRLSILTIVNALSMAISTAAFPTSVAVKPNECSGVVRGIVANPAISRVQYKQDALVSAYLMVQWVDPSDNSTHRKDLGPYKAIDTEEEFTLVDEGIPDGATVEPSCLIVKFSSYVSGIGGGVYLLLITPFFITIFAGYSDDNVFQVNKSVSTGATFRQTGTAFKGWFTYIGPYEFDNGMWRTIQ